MKSYTDIEQSKKLAEFLPLESADMLWEQHGVESYVTIKPYTTIGKSIGCHCLNCWSLAALLDVLPEPNLLENNGWHLFCDNKDHFSSSNGYNNPVDACVEMIVKLKENDLL